MGAMLPVSNHDPSPAAGCGRWTLHGTPTGGGRSRVRNCVGGDIRAAVLAALHRPAPGPAAPATAALNAARDRRAWTGSGLDFDFAPEMAWLKFLAVAFVIYFVVKGLRLDRLDKKKEA
jgi:hypothetical protein